MTSDMADKITEILQRIIRIETRATKFQQFMGWDTQAQKPAWTQDSSATAQVSIPSLHCSVKDVMDAIPTAFDGSVIVTHRGMVIQKLWATAGARVY